MTPLHQPAGTGGRLIRRAALYDPLVSALTLAHGVQDLPPLVRAAGLNLVETGRLGMPRLGFVRAEQPGD